MPIIPTAAFIKVISGLIYMYMYIGSRFNNKLSILYRLPYSTSTNTVDVYIQRTVSYYILCLLDVCVHLHGAFIEHFNEISKLVFLAIHT